MCSEETQFENSPAALRVKSVQTEWEVIERMVEAINLEMNSRGGESNPILYLSKSNKVQLLKLMMLTRNAQDHNSKSSIPS